MIFKGILVVKNCVGPDSVPLKLFSWKKDIQLIIIFMESSEPTQTFSCAMLKNGQTYFNNLAVWTPKDLKVYLAISQYYTFKGEIRRDLSPFISQFTCSFISNTFLRSSRPGVYCTKDVLRNFSELTRKHLYHGLFFNKVTGIGVFLWILWDF